MNINERAFTISGIILCLVVVLSSVFSGSGADLKTIFAEKLCEEGPSPKLNLRFQNSAVLTLVPTAPMDCQITLLPDPNCSVVIAIDWCSLGPNDRLAFRDSQNFELSLRGEGLFLDKRQADFIEGPLTIHIVTNNTQKVNTMKFQLVYTQVHDTPCYLDEFQCRNKKCIPRDLTCDGYNHCGDGSDQDECNGLKEDKKEFVLTCKENLFPWTILIFFVFVLGIVFIVRTAALIQKCALGKKETLIRQTFSSESTSRSESRISALSVQTVYSSDGTPENFLSVSL